jgi:adenosylhomocysteine nucleosidase
VTLAILSALRQEQASLVDALQRPRRSLHAGRGFWQGELHGKSVVLALSGIGKVAAATTATALIERFGAARIVFTGVAGGLGEDVAVGDVVVASGYLQHDMDASPLFPRWELPGYARTQLDCDAALSALLFESAGAYLAGAGADFHANFAARRKPRGHLGLIASGDRFVGQAEASRTLRSELGAAGHAVLAVEMEGAAVAQVCHDYGVPFAAMRSISDRADDSAHVDFTRFVHAVASPCAAGVVGRFLEML